MCGVNRHPPMEAPPPKAGIPRKPLAAAPSPPMTDPHSLDLAWESAMAPLVVCGVESFYVWIERISNLLAGGVVDEGWEALEVVDVGAVEHGERGDGGLLADGLGGCGVLSGSVFEGESDLGSEEGFGGDVGKAVSGAAGGLGGAEVLD